MQNRTIADLMSEVQELKLQLEEAKDTLEAIRRGEVDGLVVSTPKGEQVYTITGAEKPYRALIEDMHEGAVMLSQDNIVLYCNSGFAKMMKRPMEKIVGVNIESIICPTYTKAFKELLASVRKRKGAINKEITLQASEDISVPTLMSANSLQSDTLKNTFLVVTDLSAHMDEDVKRYTSNLEKEIAERKKAEETLENYRKNLEKLVEERTQKLERSNEKINEILESMHEGFYVLDRHWNFVYANKQITAALGMKPEEWVGKNLWQMFPKYAGKPIESEFRAAMEKQEIRRFESTSEYSGVSYLVTVSPSVEGISVLATDITERKRLEKQLQDQERLAAIGATAGMVGHDIRNPLQAIVSELFLAKQAMDEVPKGVDTHDALESINLIQEQVDYISKIVSDLQDYSKTLKPALVEVNICSCISETLKTIAIPDNIQTSITCDKHVPSVMLDRTFLQRILTNLAINAVQAMPKGGKLTINVEKEANDVIINVNDTGFGIPEKMKEKLFTPLFTTKAKGQGFGLSVVKRMTESLGGKVTFESQEGKGTSFAIRLPTAIIK